MVPARAGPRDDDGPDKLWWRQQIEERGASVPEPIAVVTPRKLLRSDSLPALVIGSDGRRYIVKGMQKGRSLGHRLFADQVVGRLGKMIDAPVVEVVLLSLDKAVAESNLATMHMEPGIVHGSVFLDKFELGYEIEHLNVPENPQRFARLAVLYGWAFADDHQFLYGQTWPHVVVSHDHGHFFFGGPDWDATTLTAAPAAEPDALIVEGAFLSAEAIAQATKSLEAFDPGAIAEAISIPPASWGVGLDERVALALYLERRRRELLDAVRRRS